MKAQLILVGVVLVLVNGADAQVTEEWVARYNGSGNSSDEATSLTADGNGNVYVTGGSGTFPTYLDYATIKYDATGDSVWVARYNGPGNSRDQAIAVAVDGSGYVYVTGKSAQNATYPYNYDYATIKYNAAGDTVWVRRYNGPGNGDDRATGLAVDENGTVYVTGESQGSGLGGDYATIKYNAQGDMLWVERYSGSPMYNDISPVIALDNLSNVYVSGCSYGGPATGFDYATVKYNGNTGAPMWSFPGGEVAARYNGPGNDTDWATGLAVDDNYNVYVTGWSDGNGTASDYATLKYNSDGVQQWEARYNGWSGGEGTDEPHSLAVDQDGNVYVTGGSSWDGMNSGYATVKYNPLGVQQWVARLDALGNYMSWATDLELDQSGNVYITGRLITGSPTYATDYATIKYSSSGDSLWGILYNGQVNGQDAASSLVVDGNGNVYVTGSSDGSGTGPDYATIKYSQPNAVNPWPVEVPREFSLKGASPNPFNPSTVLSYELRAASYVKLTVWDTAGKLVATLVDAQTPAGTHGATFNGSGLASGIYIAKLEAGEFAASQKLILLK